jgi:hypothetical protein
MYAFQNKFPEWLQNYKCSSEENCIPEKRNEVPLEKINLQIERNEILCGGQYREK